MTNEANSQPPKDFNGSDRKNSTENELGFRGGRGSLARTEWWDLSDNRGNPLIYRPDNFDVAMSAFSRIKVQSTKQACSGVKIYERQQSGSYNIYLMTAKHCFVEIDLLGRLRHGGAGSEHSIELTTYSPSLSVHNDSPFGIYKLDPKTKALTQPLGRLRQYTSANPTEKYSKLTYKTYMGRSDVVRLLLKTGVDEKSAKSSALPVCERNSLPSARDEVFGKQSRMFLPMVYESTQDRVLLNRMIGRNNYDGVSPNGAFNPDTTNSIFDSMSNLIRRFNLDEKGESLQIASRGGAPSTIVYFNNNGTGVEASDSGSPVLIGTRTDLATFGPRFSLFVKQWDRNHLWNNVIVNSIDCVGGVISRELRIAEYHFMNPKGVSATEAVIWRDAREMGTWTSSLIATVGERPSDWY